MLIGQEFVKRLRRENRLCALNLVRDGLRDA
jgi:hypothetical protein